MMKRITRLVIPTCFASLLSFYALAEAPVVDDSENYALLEEQQTGHKPSVASSDNTYDDSQPALAHDSEPVSSTSNNIDLVNKIQGLQQDIQELRGQLEVQAHELKQLQEQQLSFYKDLDERLRGSSALKTSKNAASTDLNMHDKPAPITSTPAKELTPATAPAVGPQASATTPPPAVVATPTRANPADEQISYLAAYELVKNKQYDEAIIAMQNFSTKYPKGGYTANAQYWLGELYLTKKNYPDAITHFDVVLQQFPSSNKYSASLLKKGYALADSGHKGEAKEPLQEVIRKYPDTNTAELAHLKLETLGG